MMRRKWRIGGKAVRWWKTDTENDKEGSCENLRVGGEGSDGEGGRDNGEM